MNSANNLNNTEYYSSGIKLPKQNNYEVAFKEAVELFLKRDINELDKISGISLSQDNSKIIVPFLNKDIIVAYPEANISYSNNKEVPLWLKILLLHYLARIEDFPPSNDQITFKQLPGGLAY